MRDEKEQKLNSTYQKGVSNLPLHLTHEKNESLESNERHYELLP